MNNYKRKKNTKKTTDKNKNNRKKSNNNNNNKNNKNKEEVIISDKHRINNDDDGSFDKVIITDDIKGGKINASKDNDTNNVIDSAITKTAEGLKSINIIKEEICKLPLDPCEKEYIDNSILPILAVAEGLSRISVNLATSVQVLSQSQIVPRKKSKIKDTIDLVYDLNEQVEDVYDVVKKRIDKLVDCVK